VTTKRTPIKRPTRQSFSPEALAAFREMYKLARECSCPPIDWGGDYRKRPPPCSACDAWWEAHSVLHKALRCEPWEFPCVENPNTVAPYPAGSPAGKNWQPDVEAQARYRALAEAAGIEV